MGSGAFGVVYAAQDTRITEAKNPRDKCVAIKKISLEVSNSTLLKRYLREIKILRLLNHRSIIKLKDIILPPSRNDFSNL